VWLRAVWKHVRTGGMHLSSLTKAKRSLYQPKAGIDHVSDWAAGFDPLRTFGVGDGSSSRCSEAEVRLTLDDAKTRHRSFDHLVGGPTSDDFPSLSSCHGEKLSCVSGEDTLQNRAQDRQRDLSATRRLTRFSFAAPTRPSNRRH
jgi:hypothetical protein